MQQPDGITKYCCCPDAGKTGHLEFVLRNGTISRTGPLSKVVQRPWSTSVVSYRNPFPVRFSRSEAILKEGRWGQSICNMRLRDFSSHIQRLTPEAMIAPKVNELRFFIPVFAQGRIVPIEDLAVPTVVTDEDPMNGLIYRIQTEFSGITLIT